MAGRARLHRNPCPIWQPALARNACCAAISTPSAVLAPDLEDPAKRVARANEAPYIAKRSGRHRVEPWAPAETAAAGTVPQG